MGDHPPFRYDDYRSTILRAPSRPPVGMRPTITETTGPDFAHDPVKEGEADLTTQHAGEPLGQRIIVTGRLLEADGRPIPASLVEVWQANASGRYAHSIDNHPAPLDPNFTGVGRCLTDDEGSFRFVTVQPGAYPWGNHPNAWRPAHIHFSVFGPSFITRLVTQMYFPGDPLLEYDPIYQSVPEHARERLISVLDLDITEPDWALGYRFDIVVGGRNATPGQP